MPRKDSIDQGVVPGLDAVGDWRIEDPDLFTPRFTRAAKWGTSLTKVRALASIS